ncbi:hypothetical protein Tco_1014288 [Tanacetum coccineum]
MANLDFYNKHNMVAYLQKSEGSEGFHQIVDFRNICHIKYALIENPTIYVSLIEQFWQIAFACTLKNGDMEITATIDGKVKVVSEASIRRHLKLKDSDGIITFPTAEIFEELALMGSKKTAWEQFSSNIATAIICLATNRTFNYSKLIFDGMVKNLESKSKFLMYPRFIQIFLNKQKKLLLPHQRTYIAPSLTQKLFSNMKRALKGYNRVDTPLFQTMLVQGQILQGEGLTIPVKSHHTPTVAPLTSQPHNSPTLRDFIRQETEVPQPSSSTQTHVADKAASIGQGSGNIDKTPAMPHDSPLPRVHTLGSDEGRMQPNELMELVTKLSDKITVLENDLKQTKKTYGAAFTKLIKKVKTLEKTIKSSKARRRAQSVTIHHDVQTQGRQEYDLEPNFEFTIPKEVYTTEPDISTANVPVSTASAKVSIAAKSLVYIRRSAVKRKDKGKAIVEESKPTQIKNKIQQEQERLGFEEAQRLQEQFNKEERQRIANVHEEESTFKPEEWDNIQAQIEADEELAHIDNLPNKELNKGGIDLSHMLNKVLFEARVKRVNTFTLMESDDTVPKVVAGSSKRSAEEELDELSQEQLQQLIIIVPEEGMNVEALQTKYPIIDWEDLVRERFSSIEPTDDKERALWVELKRLFEPDTDDLLELQRYMHDPLTWRLYDTCGVHHVSTETGLDIFMLVEKDYPMTRGFSMLMLVNKLQVDQHSEMADELLRKILILFSPFLQEVEVDYHGFIVLY